jgi:adenosylcobalamin phosphodiesterase
MEIGSTGDVQQHGFVPLPGLRGKRSYRLGVSSYVYEADLAMNVRQVAGAAGDVELVLFETRGASNIPTERQVAELGDLARAAGMTYTVHFPIEYRMGDAEVAVRRGFLEQATRLLTLTQGLPVWAYILHLEGIRQDAAADEVRRWQEECSRGIEELLVSGVDAGMLVVENLSAPFEWHWPLIERYGLSVCVDIGHLWRAGYHVADHLERYLPRTRLIHLHGEKGGKDHISLTHVEEERLRPVLERLAGFEGVVTLELFGYEDVASSIEVLNRLGD